MPGLSNLFTFHATLEKGAREVSIQRISHEPRACNLPKDASMTDTVHISTTATRGVPRSYARDDRLVSSCFVHERVMKHVSNTARATNTSKKLCTAAVYGSPPVADLDKLEGGHNRQPLTPEDRHTGVIL